MARRREPLCAGCRRLLRRLGPDPVMLCGVPVWAPVAYTGPARDLVRALKFRSATAVADAMAAQIAANAPEALLGAASAPAALLTAANAPAAPLGAVSSPSAPLVAANAPGVALGAVNSPSAPLGAARATTCATRVAPPPTLVPVPLHPRRLRRRGYNQAGLIAEALSWRLGLDVADCLARAGSTATQVGRDRRERRSGPAGSVEARGPVPGRALLVDDVATTGATLAACAAALRAVGSVEVAAVVFARTIGR